MLQAALAYASFGWAVFPTHSIRDGKCTCCKADCSSPGKHPLTRHGFKDATTNPTMIRQWWRKYPWANIAIATGEKSGRLLVIDIDCKPDRSISGEETWRDVEQDCPATVEVLTGGGGRHLYFYYLESVKIKSGAGMIGPGVDVRADSGYVLAPPSLHLSGRRYEWEGSSDPLDGIVIAPAPDWLLEFFVKPAVDAVTCESQTELLAAPKVQEIRSALAFIDSDPRDTWLKVGMALKSTHAEQQAYGLWTEWSMQSGKYEPRDQHRTWQSLSVNGGVSLSTIFWLAKQNGWVELDSAPSAVETPATARSPTRPDIDEELVKPPGILNDIVQYILSSSRRPQPEFAVNAALALAGTVLGRRYITESELRTNLYLISVGPTASGKDHPRKIVKNILTAASLHEMIGGENLASGQGLLSRVKRTPVVLFQLDEFGLMLQSLQHRSAGRHAKEILINMIRLFSSADSVFVGTEYADQANRPTVQIEYPCVCIHATTTPETFYSALESRNVIDGFLNRFIVVDLTEKPRPPLQKQGLYPDVPASILDWIEGVMNSVLQTGNMSRFNAPPTIVVKQSPEASELFESFKEFSEKQVLATAKTGIDALWSRALEHALKIALVCACSDQIDNPVVEPCHAQWAIRFVQYHTEYLAHQVKERIADTEFERMVNEFYIAILEAGERGLTKRDMDRRKPFRSYPPRERRPVFEVLEQAGQIAMCEIKTYGRKRHAYVAIDIEAKDEER